MRDFLEIDHILREYLKNENEIFQAEIVMFLRIGNEAP